MSIIYYEINVKMQRQFESIMLREARHKRHILYEFIYGNVQNREIHRAEKRLVVARVERVGE